MQNLNRTAVENNLNRILGTDFKVRNIEDGLKVNVPLLDVTQMSELGSLYEDNSFISNITAKRSGVGITIIVTVNE